MSEVVLFHSVLGIRQGITDAAVRLRSKGHIVHVPNLYGDGVFFDDYKKADVYVQSIGSYPELLRRTRKAIENIPSNVVYAGFSNGGASAEYLAATRANALGAILFSAATPLKMLLQIGEDEQRPWPSDVPVQLHYMKKDPFRNEEWVNEFSKTIKSSHANFSFYEYSGKGHLFTDKSLVDEYDQDATEKLWKHVDTFLFSLTKNPAKIFHPFLF